MEMFRQGNIMDFVSPIKSIELPTDVVSKLQKLRTFSPTATTSDIANLLSMLAKTQTNTFKKQTMTMHATLLLDKILQFAEFWNERGDTRSEKAFESSSRSGKESSAPSSPTTLGKDNMDFLESTTSNASSVNKDDWLDHDRLEYDEIMRELQFLRRQMETDAEVVRTAKQQYLELETLREDNDELKTTCERLDQALRDLQSQSQLDISAAQRENKVLNQAVEKLNEELMIARKNWTSYSETTESLITELNELKLTNQHLHNSMDELEAKLSDHGKENAALVNGNLGLDEELHSALVSKNSLEAEVALLREELSAKQNIESTLILTQQARQSAELNYKKYLSEYEAQVQINQSLTVDMNKKETLAKKLAKRYESLTTEIDELKVNNTKLEDLKRKNEETIKSMTNQYEVLRVNSAAAEAQRDSLQKRVESLDSDMAVAFQTNKALSEELETVKQERVMILQALDNSQRKLNEATELLENASKQETSAGLGVGPGFGISGRTLSPVPARAVAVSALNGLQTKAFGLASNITSSLSSLVDTQTSAVDPVPVEESSLPASSRAASLRQQLSSKIRSSYRADNNESDDPQASGAKVYQSQLYSQSETAEETEGN